MRASIQAVCHKVAELDAAGVGLVVLQSESFADMAEIAERYVFKTRREVPLSMPTREQSTRWESNMYEVCGAYLREFGSPVVSKDLTASATNGKLQSKLIDAVDSPEHQMIFFHSMEDLTDQDGEPTILSSLIRLICHSKSIGANRTLLLAASQGGNVPACLSEYAYIVDVPYPEVGEILEIVDESLRECMDTDYFALPPPLLNEIAEAFRGFRASVIRGVLQQAFSAAEMPIENNAALLLSHIVTAKKQLLMKTGGLQWIESDCDQISGLNLLRSWIDGQRLFFHSFAACAAHQEKAPKGVLVAGVPGSGKSLMAKNMARIWGIPLLKMDMGSLMGRYLGESEANVARALRLAETLSPCVLWIDELEKAFAGVSGDAEDSQAMMRVFHSFLTWLQDRKKPCFVFATANSVTKLPSEFLRKERFDDKFYVFMPTAQECREIIISHLRSRAASFDQLRNIEDDQMREQMLNSVASGIADQMLRLAAVKGKFLTGADIASMIKSAFRSLFIRKFSALSGDVQALAASQRVIYYTALEVEDALRQELEETKTYGEDMTRVVGYWLSLLGENPFRPASSPNSGRYDIDQKQFDQKTGAFSWIDEEDYEAVVQERLEKARERQDYDDCFALELALVLRKTIQERRAV